MIELVVFCAVKYGVASMSIRMLMRHEVRSDGTYRDSCVQAYTREESWKTLLYGDAECLGTEYIITTD